ncbi:MAG TPA: hypothetical protein VM913_04210 [Sphingomicrobium sp.]|nr:hypothetical protein [Sphingomicrobium sp.]
MIDIVATNPQSHINQDEELDVAALAVKAERCRRLAAGILDTQASEVLRSMADDYERSAAELNRFRE